ncbi:MAG TPA: hypothetical protein VGY55_01920 [Pirellulales bacterium]|jgi:hypothetical protein|nr:hypothetical protein [Pirellulales bacterium]
MQWQQIVGAGQVVHPHPQLEAAQPQLGAAGAAQLGAAGAAQLGAAAAQPQLEEQPQLWQQPMPRMPQQL